jgi:lipoate-protein ligase B
VELDRVDYAVAWDLQKRIAQARVEGKLDRDALLLLEHDPVFTLGRRGGHENIQVPMERLQSSGIPVYEIERGGNVTYHGPGQLVGYPIAHLRESRIRLLDFINALEETMIRCAADFGVVARRDDRNRGVWVGDNKLGALGIAVRRGVSFHGFALNVNLSLEHFQWINPCGLRGVGVTSISRELGREVSMKDARASARRHLSNILGVNMELTDLDSLAI